jgi:nitroreductase
MNVKEAIVSRRSVKHYDPEHQMSAAEVTELMEHAILSPTAFNIQHWRFVNVVDKNKREQIQKASWG